LWFRADIFPGSLLVFRSSIFHNLTKVLYGGVYWKMLAKFLSKILNNLMLPHFVEFTPHLMRGSLGFLPPLGGVWGGKAAALRGSM